jgi:hypothetical protein
MGSAGRGEKTLFGVEKGQKTRQGKVVRSLLPSREKVGGGAARMRGLFRQADWRGVC